MSKQLRIDVSPDVRSGKPCIVGTRITVQDVLEYLRGGMTEEQLLADFPALQGQDIQAVREFSRTHDRRDGDRRHGLEDRSD